MATRPGLFRMGQWDTGFHHDHDGCFRVIPNETFLPHRFGGPSAYAGEGQIQATRMADQGQAHCCDPWPESKAKGTHAKRLAKGGASAESARRSLISGEFPSTLAVADKGRPSKLDKKARAAAHASSPDQRRT